MAWILPFISMGAVSPYCKNGMGLYTFSELAYNKWQKPWCNKSRRWLYAAFRAFDGLAVSESFD